MSPPQQGTFLTTRAAQGMDGWAIKHRKRQEAPPAPKRKATHARRVAPAPAARLDDAYDWLVDGGPPVVDGGSANLTCRTTDAILKTQCGGLKRCGWSVHVRSVIHSCG